MKNTLHRFIPGLATKTVLGAVIFTALIFCVTNGSFAADDNWSQTTFDEGTFNNTTTTAGDADVLLDSDAVNPTWSIMTNAPETVYQGGSLCFTGGDYIYAFRGYGTKTFWRYSISGNSWTAMTDAPDTVSWGGALVYPGSGDYVYALRGNSTNSFWHYSISGNSWGTLENTPANVGTGGALCSTDDDYIYAFGGGNTANFWRYDIQEDFWSSMESTPANVGSGGALVYPGSGNYIFALRGNSTTDFWSYDIQEDSWNSMASTPATINYGGSLAYPGSGDYIYALRGNNSSKFYRYSITGNSWVGMGGTPGYVIQGGALCAIGGDNLYAFQGGTTAFWRYAISSESPYLWTELEDTSANVKYGGALCSTGDDYIYSFRGNTQKDFWRYSISGDSWTAMTDAPDTVFSGGSLTYPGSGDFIYALRGNYTTTFWRYSISGNSWSTMTSTSANVGAGGALCSTGDDYIYAFRGGYNTTFWRYSISGDSWTAMTSTSADIHGGGALCYPGSGNYIYALRGNTQRDFWRYSISGNTWSTMASTPVNVGYVGWGGSLAYPGSGDYIYASNGNNTAGLWRYSITGDSWLAMVAAPANIYGGGALCYPGSGAFLYALRGNDTTDFYRYQCRNYETSGNYISPAITPDYVYSWGVLSFNADIPDNTTFTVDVLTLDNTPIVSNVPNNTNLSQTYPSEFSNVTAIKLRGNFSSTVSGVTPVLHDWSIIAPPFAPSNLVATAVSSSQINLTWQDNSNNEQGFKIEVKLGLNGTFTQMAIVSANTTSYSDTNLYPTANYYYRIKAYNEGVDSGYSNIDNARTLAPASPPPAETRQDSAQRLVAIFSPVNWQSISISVLETPTPYQPENSLDEEPYVSEQTQGTLIFAYADILGNCVEEQRIINISNTTKTILYNGTPVTTLGEIYTTLPTAIGSDSVTLLMEFSYHLTIAMAPVSALSLAPCTTRYKADDGITIITTTAVTAIAYSNCHGWTFTCGKTQLSVWRGVMDTILNQNGYKECDATRKPQVGDLVVFRGTPGGLESHSGIVTGVDAQGNVTEIESKPVERKTEPITIKASPEELSAVYGTPTYYYTDRRPGTTGKDQHTLQSEHTPAPKPEIEGSCFGLEGLIPLVVIIWFITRRKQNWEKEA